MIDPTHLRWRFSRLVHGRMLRTPAGKMRIVLPPPSNFRSFYVFALHKSGSTLMNGMLSEAFDHAGVSHFSPSECAFSAGLPENEITNPEIFIFPHGYCYRGFRGFPPYLKSFDISSNKKILLIRDPRDMLVSDYFSVRFSHPLPETGAGRSQFLEAREFANKVGIDEFCLSRIQRFKDEFTGFDYVDATEMRRYRYEDVIFKKAEWLFDMLSYFAVDVPTGVVDQIAKRHDIRPEAERPNDHVRQVSPGNFRRHLNDATIEALNAEFGDVLRRYGYPL